MLKEKILKLQNINEIKYRIYNKYIDLSIINKNRQR